MFTQLNLWIGAAGGATFMLVLAFTYNQLIDNPAVVRETTVKVEAEARANTFKAINEVSDAAEKARAMRRYCIDSGMQYDFSSGKCR